MRSVTMVSIAMLLLVAYTQAGLVQFAANTGMKVHNEEQRVKRSNTQKGSENDNGSSESLQSSESEENGDEVKRADGSSGRNSPSTNSATIAEDKNQGTNAQTSDGEGKSSCVEEGNKGTFTWEEEIDPKTFKAVLKAIRKGKKKANSKEAPEAGSVKVAFNAGVSITSVTDLLQDMDDSTCEVKSDDSEAANDNREAGEANATDKDGDGQTDNESEESSDSEESGESAEGQSQNSEKEGDSDNAKDSEKDNEE